jgi:streptogramin lyase
MNYEGGETRDGWFTNSVERFNPRTDSWTEVRPMCAPRADHAAVAAQGRLFVSGGISDRTGANINFW